MERLDKEIYEWVKLAKGDVQGHPFHGNQWSTRNEGSVRAILGRKFSDDLSNSNDAANASSNAFPTSGKPTSSQLRDLAKTHEMIAGYHPDEVNGVSPKTIDGVFDAHQKVSDIANGLADKIDAGGGYTDEDNKNLSGAVADAANASNRVIDEYTAWAPGY